MDESTMKLFKTAKSNKIKVVTKFKVIEIIYKPKLLICKANTVRDVLACKIAVAFFSRILSSLF